MFYLVDENLMWDILPQGEDTIIHIKQPMSDEQFNKMILDYHFLNHNISMIGITYRNRVQKYISKYTSNNMTMEYFSKIEYDIFSGNRLFICHPIPGKDKAQFIEVEVQSRFVFKPENKFTFEHLLYWVIDLDERFKSKIYFEHNEEFSWKLTIERSTWDMMSSLRMNTVDSGNKITIKISAVYNEDMNTLSEPMGFPVCEIEYFEGDNSIHVEVNVYDNLNENIEYSNTFVQFLSSDVVSSELLDSIRRSNTGYGIDLMEFLQNDVGPDIINFFKDDSDET